MKATDWLIIIIKNWTGGMLERGRVTFKLIKYLYAQSFYEFQFRPKIVSEVIPLSILSSEIPTVY